MEHHPAAKDAGEKKGKRGMGGSGLPQYVRRGKIKPLHSNIKDLKVRRPAVIRKADTWVALLVCDLVIRCS